MTHKFFDCDFNNFILNNNVVGFFEEPIKLKSGRRSHFYVNWRKPTSNTSDLRYVASKVIDFAAFENKLKPDCFLGVPEGATKLGIITQYKWTDHASGPAKGQMPMLRSKPKDHGVPQDKYFVGAPEGRVIIIEDVTTTGNSLISTIRNLKDADVNVIAAIGLTNRMERRDDGLSVEEAMKLEGVPYHHMSSALELLPEAAKRQNTPRRILNEVEREFERYGVTSLRF